MSSPTTIVNPRKTLERVMSDEVIPSFAELDAALARLDWCVTQLREVQSLDVREPLETFRKAADQVEALHAMAAGLATRANVELPSWNDRTGYVAVVASLQATIERNDVRERESIRCVAIGDAINRGEVVHSSPRLRGAYEAIARGAAEAMRAHATGEAPYLIEGPPTPEAWIAWARDHLEQLRAVVPEAVLEFLEHVPEQVWRSRPLASDPRPDASEAPVVSSADVMPSKDATTSPGAPEPLTARPVETAIPPEITAIHALAPGEGSAPQTIAALPNPLRDPDVAPVSAPRSVSPDREARDVAALSDVERLASRQEPAFSPSTPTSVDVEFEPELRSFESYCDGRWVAPSGQITNAPWREPAFPERLSRAFAEAAALPEPQFATLWLTSAASRVLGVDMLPVAEDIVSTASLWASGIRGSGTVDPQRAARLRDTIQSGRNTETPSTRLQLVLEALDPSQELSADEVEQCVEFAGFKDRSLRTVVELLLGQAARGAPPMSRLRDALDPAKNVDPSVVVRRVEETREAFRKEFMRVRHAGGGNIEHTHCREVWGSFILAIDPVVRQLVDPPGAVAWALDELAKRVRDIEPTHRKIADKGGAKLKDRHKMDRMAERLHGLAVEIVSALRAQAQIVARRPGFEDGSELVAAWRQLEAAGPLVGDEELARGLLLRQVGDASTRDEREPFGLTLEALVARPSLAACFADLDLSGAERAPGVGVVVADIRKTLDPRLTAAVWLEPPLNPEGDEAGTCGLFRALDQPHLRAALGSLIDRFPEADRLRIHRARASEKQDLWRKHDRLRTAWRRLADLVVGMAPEVRRVVGDIEGALEADVAVTYSPLYGTWLDAVADRCDAAEKRAIESLVTAADALDSTVADAVRAALTAERYVDAHRLLHDTGGEIRRDEVRQTAFRPQARAQFAQTLGRLHSITTRKDLVTAWTRGVTGDMNRGDHTLRTAFAEAFFRAAELQVHNHPKELRVSCEQLRDWFRRKQLNPSFVPQLARFRELVVLTPPHSPQHSGFVQSVGLQVAGYDGHLVAVLAPKISDRIRSDLATELRRRGIAGVIDDLDLCRMLNPGGPEPNLVIALIEVLLEQQRWGSVTPFLLPDGQNVHMEMFVGRRDEARELAHTARYSRLFSGRKLGKSALLRFVEATEDGHRLPSGRTLRVLYVSAVGVDSERVMVQRIDEALRGRFQMRPEPLLDRLAQPGERLQELLRWFRAARPDDSLLVVLDEADAFVEQQLVAYERERERCLSFFMRSTIEQDRDEQGLPRVRFVFSGYRVTNTSEGTWANWGDVLRLTPLAPDDAADLVARPLARLGVDCIRSARAIAHRCGHQPAVLLRLGECLLMRVEGRHPIAARDQQLTEVTDEDIALAFEDDRVQDEIRTVVRNNFQGNPVGRVIFGAVLAVFLRAPPGQSLDDLEDRLLEVLRALSDDDLRWLGEGDATVRGVVRMRLRDLVERQLLAERRVPGSVNPAYQVRFPHHLPTLTPLSQEGGLRDEIRSLRRAEASDGASVRRDVLSRADIQQIRELLAWREVRALPVVVSLWPSALMHSSVGLPDRLGIDNDRVLSADSSWLDAGALERPRRALVHHVAPARLTTLVGGSPREAPLPVCVGGVDLFRWALRARQPSGCPWGDDVLVETFALGRWSQATLAWWFARVRGVNFPRPDALEVIQSSTGGVGFLVRLFDEILFSAAGGSEGQDVPPDVFNRAVDLYGRERDAHVRRLRDGDTSTRLDPREIEILRMVVHASPECRGDDLRQLLMDLWEDFFRPALDVPPLSASDAVSLGVVQGLGLLPSRLNTSPSLPFDRLVPIPQGDVAHLIVAALAG